MIGQNTQETLEDVFFPVGQAVKVLFACHPLVPPIIRWKSGGKVNWEGEPASRFPLPTLATKTRGSLLPFPTDFLIGV
jgi:hypothetical protein